MSQSIKTLTFSLLVAASTGFARPTAVQPRQYSSGCTTYTGYMTVSDATSGDFLGYVSNYLDPFGLFGNITDYVDNALEITFEGEPDAENQSVQGVTLSLVQPLPDIGSEGYAGCPEDYTFITAVLAPYNFIDSASPDLSPDSWNSALLSVTNVADTAPSDAYPHSTPAGNETGYPDGWLPWQETCIWNYDTVYQSFTPFWYVDSTLVPLGVEWMEGIFALTGNNTAFESYIPAVSAQVQFGFQPSDHSSYSKRGTPFPLTDFSRVKSKVSVA